MREIFTCKAFAKKKHDVDLDENWADSGQLPDRIAEVRSELAQTLNALQKLPEIDRAALLLQAKERLPVAEIARVLGLSISAVKVKIHRARIKLAELAQKAEEHFYEGDK